MVSKKMYVCICFQKTDSEINKIIEEFKCENFETLSTFSDVGSRCGRCYDFIEKIFENRQREVISGKLE